MIIDCHTHAPTIDSMKKLVASMKKNKIAKSLVLYYRDIAEWAIGAPHLREFMKNIASYPNLYAIGSIRMTNNPDFKKDLGELEGYVKNKKIVGIKIYLGYERIYANDPKLDPVYKLCLKYDIPVIFHTGDILDSPQGMIRFANPVPIDDVASKNPSLKILICHLGNPWTRETALIVNRHKNVYTDISGTLSAGTKYKRQDNEFLKKRVLELVAWCDGPKKLLFGTDFDGLDKLPYKQEDYIQFLKTFKFSKEELELINHLNAEKLFKI